MIDTLFYFVDTELEYRRQMQGENGQPGISPTTIVFVGDSREIYVNGKGYGKTSTNGLLASSEFDQWKGQLNERINNVITNAASDNEEARQKAEEDLEAAMTLVQSMMDTSAEEMATTIQSVRNQIQEAKTELQENIDSANDNADEILSALTTFQGTIRNELETSIRDAITNANGRTIWSELNTTNEGITAMTNRIDQSLNPDGSIKSTEALLSIIDSGVRNNTAITDIQNKWAVMDDNQNVIEWVASGFKSLANNEGGLAAVFASAQNDTQNAISAMKTEIEQDVAGNYVASADLGTSVIGIVEDELQVDSLSSLAMKSDVNAATTTITNRLNTLDTTTGNLLTSLSQVSSVAEEGKARASLLTSVGENGTYLVNESSLDGAMSSILTKSESGSAALIHQMAQDDIAAADISSLIDEATSTLATKVEVNQVVNNLTGEIENRKTAVAGLQAQITGEDGLTNTIAGVDARVTDNEAQLTSIALWQQGTDTWKAGVVQSADLDGAVAGLIADGTKESGKKTRAAVVATVNDDTSAIKINADHVFLDANKTTTISTGYDNLYNPAKNGVNTSLAEIRQDASEKAATLTALTTWKDNKEYQAGLVSESGLDGAMATLIAKDGTGANAKVSAIVNDGLSSLTLSADRVYIAGQQNVNIMSHYDGELENIGRDIDALEGTVSGHTTSIAQLNTNASVDHASLTALTTWKNNEEYKSGLVSEAGLGGSMASLIAENTAVKAAITARVKDDASQISLTADQIYLDSSKETKIASQYDPSKNGVNTAINNLNDTVGSHTTSIASLTTNANADHATLQAITEWKDTDAYKSGLLTTAGLGGAVASLFASNANTDAKANVTAMVDGKLSTLKLSADKVYIEGNQETSIKSYFDTELSDAIDDVESDIDSLSNTVAGHTTSISNISTAANNNASSIQALSTWKNDFVGSYKSGLVTEAGLGGAVASLIAENADVKASITTRVKDDASEIELNADQIKLSGSTLANRIEATEGTIGGVTIANNDIHSANNKFKVTSDGKLTATDATITGAITATSLSLGTNKISTDNITGLSAVATSGSYSSLTGKPNLSAVATSGSYSDLSNKPTIPTVPDNIITADQVSISEETTSDGITTKTITVGDNTYTSIVSGDFVKTNIGLGTTSGKYVKIDSDGLLTAKNAVVYGTIYATGGQIGGIGIKNNSIESDNGNFSVTSAGKLTAKDAEITGKIKATSLELVNSKIQTNLIDGLSAIATSGSYSDLSGTPTIPSKLSQLTNDKGFIDNSALNGYALAANVPTSVTQLTGGANILHTTDITTSETTNPTTGIKTKTINLGGGKSYTTISDNNGFIYTNVGYGTQNSNHTSSYFLVSTDGLLTANNAVIYGTVYATNGSFSGKVESTSGHIGGFEIGNTLLSATDAFHWGNTEAEYFDGEVKRGTIYIASQVQANSTCPSNISFPTSHTVYDDLALEGGVDHWTEYVSLPAIKCVLTPNMESPYHTGYRGACETVISPYGIATKSSDAFDEQYDLNNGLEGEPTNWICSDGSGYLGKGGIKWTKEGRFSISEIDSLTATGPNYHGGVLTTAIINGVVAMTDDDNKGNNIGAVYMSPSEIEIYSGSDITTITPGSLSTNTEDHGSFDVYGGTIKVNDHSGVTDTVTIGDVTFTIESGIITGVTYAVMNLKITPYWFDWNQGSDRYVAQWFSWNATTTNASDIANIQIRLNCVGLCGSVSNWDFNIAKPNGQKSADIEPLRPCREDGDVTWRVTSVTVLSVTYSDGTTINYNNGETGDSRHHKPTINLTCEDCSLRQYTGQ